VNTRKEVSATQHNSQIMPGEASKTFDPEKAKQLLAKYDAILEKRGLLPFVSGVDASPGVRAARQAKVHNP
jgi:hypothetical protein